MLKLIGALLIISGCGYAGFTIAKKYRNRPRELHYLRSALQMLETEIAYGATPLPDALELVAARCAKEVAELFSQTREALLSGEGVTAGEAWERALKKFYTHSAINAGDAAILRALGMSLGISDREDQIKHLHLAQEQLKIEIAKAEEEAAKNVKLYNYLGFLGGLSIVIVFI